MFRIFFIAVLSPALLYAQSRDLMRKLASDVLNNPTLKLTPFSGGSRTVDVFLSFLPGAVLDLDPGSQILTFTGSLTLLWTDPALTWDESKYNDLAFLRLEENEVWIPDVILLNGKSRQNIVRDRSGFLGTTSNGTVGFSVIDEFQTTCNVDVSDFPFDLQQCHLMIFSPNKYYVNLTTLAVDTIDLGSLLVESAEWELVEVGNVQMYSDTGRAYQVMTLTLKRSSLFYVTNIIFPMGLTSVMNAGVFILPASSGEKVSYLVSIFVSHAIFLNFIYDITPRTSSSIPKLTSYLMCVLGQSFLALVATAVVLHLHQRKPKVVTQVEPQTNGEPKLEEGRGLKNVLVIFSNAMTLDCLFFFIFMSFAIFNTVIHFVK